ncbi:unnamed protein product [Adineta steineri]|uniref:BZIP domain-containing protein n=1 Tax=Adineta steineri TaxID=433720 RepID=A0A814R282_9BILA|nr:unnamed protein product [Adineta steineri]
MHPHYGFVGSTYVGNNVGIKQVQQIYGNSIHHQQVPFYSQHSNYSSIHSHQQRNQHYPPYQQQQQAQAQAQAQQQQQQQINNVECKLSILSFKEREKMFENSSSSSTTTGTYPTSTLKCLLENTELADLLFKNFPILDDDNHLKSDKQLLSNELASKVAWNSSAFLGPNLWDKDQLYSANGNGNGNGNGNNNGTTSTSTLHNEKTTNGNFKVENIDIDEFLCENNLNLNDIESFSNHFEHVEQTTSNSPNQNQDTLILHSPMQAAPAKSPADDSISRQSSSSSRKYSQDEVSSKNGHIKQSKKSRKAQHQSKFVPDELKDEKYWARRRKNNLAAKRSRDARRMKENQIALRADFLERESDLLKKQLEDLKRENQKLKMKLIQYESSIKQ